MKSRFFMAKCTIKHTPMPIPSHKTILIGGLNPLKNMKVSWDDYSQYIGKKNPNHQPD